MTTRQDVAVRLDYKQKPLIRVFDETFPVKDYLVKGVKAQGVKLTTKETTAAKFVRSTGAGAESDNSAETEEE